MKDNQVVVLSAIRQHGRALYYASDDMKNNPVAILAAVQQNGIALRYASDEMYNIKTKSNWQRLWKLIFFYENIYDI